MRNRIVSADCLVEFWRTLSDEEKLALADNPSLLKRFLQRLAKRAERSIFVVPLSDDEAVAWLVANKKCDEAEAKSRVARWRRIANDHGYNGPVAWKVRKGYTLKGHASQDKGAYQKLAHLQGWDLKNDEATKDSLVFWVPRLAENSAGNTIPEMETLRSKLRQRYKLPSHHATNFGSVALLFALVLAHFNRTGERVPLHYFYAASDTFPLDGFRLTAGDFDEYGLFCNYWDESARDDVGFLLLGVEEELGK